MPFQWQDQEAILALLTGRTRRVSLSDLAFYTHHTPLAETASLRNAALFISELLKTFGHNWDVQGFLSRPPKRVAEVTPAKFMHSQLESDRGFLEEEGNVIVLFVKYTC